MPLVASASLAGFVSPGATAAATVAGLVVGPHPAGVEGLLSRQAVESLSGPSIAYRFAVKLGGAWIPETELLGPLEVDESIDTVAALFSFSLAGRRWSIEATEKTWTLTPVEVWVPT